MDSDKNQEYIALNDLWDLSPQKRLVYLIKQWDLVDECVYGEIKEHSFGKYCTLINVKNINAIPLEYPVTEDELSNIPEPKRVTTFGIYAGMPKSIPFGQLVRAQLSISSPYECKRSNNPLSVEVKSVELLTFIPSSFVKTDAHGNVIIEESVKQFVIENKKEEISKKISESKDKLDKNEKQLQEAVEKIASQSDELKQVSNEIADGHEIKAQLKIDINEEKKELNRVKNECNHEKQKEIERLERAKEEAKQKMTQLKEYVQSKADFLRDLKLISKKQFNYVTGSIDRTPEDNEPHLDFINDLNGDFDKLISHIQAYLYSKDKYYTKSVLGNFLTLLRTNDLIIISGASGTGKSYLVKAFAQAIGGVAKIVPVKPNWTSSEDLLGYYNPMQKSYMTTPFLDAIVAAERDPYHLHLICLDEMNLARVEYYFADFLSVLEEREKPPKISLYSTEEADHIKSEFETIIGIFDDARSVLPDTKFSNFGDFLQHKEITQKLLDIFGNSESNSLVDLYGKIRRMVGGVLDIPAEFEFPANVRIIGTINIDQTTHYFAPKVLDRAYLLKFESPLATITLVKEEVGEIGEDPSPVYLPPADFWSSREPYPRYDSTNVIASKIGEWNKEFLSPMGIEVGMRVMRQVLLFQKLYKDLQAERPEQLFESDTLNIILLMKIFPHFMFDGDLSGVKDNNEVKKHDLVKQFGAEINEILSPTIERHESNNASREIQRMIQSAEHNDKVYNYWT